MDVGSLGRRRQVADRHVLDHPAAERAYIGHLGVSRLWGGLQPHDPGRRETAHVTTDRTSFSKRFSSIKKCTPPVVLPRLHFQLPSVWQTSHNRNSDP